MNVLAGDQMMTRPILVGIGALLGIAIAVAVLSRPATTPVVELVAPVESRQLVFADRADGGLEIADGRTGKPVLLIPPGVEGTGFLRSTMRGFARERKRAGQGAEQPFLLARDSTGLLLLEDPATQRRVVLTAFGPTNAAVFAQLLREGSKVP